MNQGLGQFLYGVPEKAGGLPYIIATTSSKNKTWGKNNSIKDAYITISGAINRARYLSTQDTIDLSANTGEVTIKIEKATTNVNLSGDSWRGGLEITKLDTTKNKEIVILNISYNTIRAHNLIMSKNIKLKTLINTYANFVTSRSSIDLTKNIALEGLLWHSSELSYLDLSKNINLRWVDFYHNSSLRSVDFTKNVKLQSITLFTTYINPLNLTKNIELKTLSIKGVSYDTLDLTKNVNLETLIGQVNFKTIDLTKNVNLKKLDLYNNKLTSLDLSKNTLLTEFNLQNNTWDTMHYDNSPLMTIHVNQDQLNKLNAGQLPNWKKQAHQKYELKT